jgi:hypothetical protein
MATPAHCIGSFWGPGSSTERRGLPLGFLIVPASEYDQERLADLLTGVQSPIAIAAKGFCGRDYRTHLASIGTTLLDSDRTHISTILGSERALASSRRVIESVFSNRNEQMPLDTISHKHSLASASVSLNASSCMPSECCSIPSVAATHAPSPPTTVAKSHQPSPPPPTNVRIVPHLVW